MFVHLKEDLEAFALMTSGYRMTEHEFRYSKGVDGFPEPAEQVAWDFLAVEEGMKGSGAKYDYLKRQLSASHALAFKIWKLSQPLKITSWLLGIAALAFVIWACFHWATWTVVPAITLWGIGVFMATSLLVFVVSYVFGKWVMRVAHFRETLMMIVIGLSMALLGWIAARIHLHIFDPLFLRGGSLGTFEKQD
jgi:hypothetical protein